MARLGAHAFLWAPDWTRQAAERVLTTAAAAGLDLVEIPLLRPDEVDAAHTKAFAEEVGVALTCSLGLPAESTLPDHPAEAEAFLKRTLDVCHALGASVLTGVTYATLGRLSGRPPEDAEYATIVAALRPVARHAASLGMGLGIEACNRYETHLVNTGRQAAEMVERVGEDNVFAHLDTYHMNIEEQSYEQGFADAGKHLGYVHLSESNRGIPGRGSIDWAAVFRGLKAVGYDGDLVLESFLMMHPDIARALAVWRPVAESPEAVVDEGLPFIRQHMREQGLAA